MDRLIATSRADSPDWPLPSLPPPSLTNVSKESRRHCRVFPTGMVNLSLAQMTDTVDRAQHNEHHAGDNCRQTDFMEQDSEKLAFNNSWRMEKSRKKNTEKKREYIRPENIDDVMYAVDALQSQPDSPDSTTELSYPYYHALSPPLNSPASTTELSYPLPPSSTSSSRRPSSPTIPIAELDARDTAIPPPSPPLPINPSPSPTFSPTPSPFPPINHTTPLHSHPPAPTDFIINPTTPLLSNPPTPAERAFARTLHTASKQSFEPRRPPPPRPLHTTLATYDAVTAYRESLAPITAKRTFIASVVNSGFGGVVAMAARASLKKRGRREGKERGVKMSFLEGVGKAFKDVFGEREERCW